MPTWLVKVKGETVACSFTPPPTAFCWFPAKLGQESVELRWEPQIRTLYIRSPGGGLERVLHVRSYFFPASSSELTTTLDMGMTACPGSTITAQTFASGPEALYRPQGSSKQKRTIASPMTGKVLKVMKKIGDPLTPGEVIATIEAMKMENNIVSPCAGILETLNLAAGTSVSVGSQIASITPSA